ncbi:MAG: hypothetical protein ACRD3B_06430, partial [Candidatus Sulfotelmatobacter sp.]
PSQRAPSGAKGRRVVLTRKAAEAALPSLLGMALDYAPTFDRHDVRRKVGVITEADVVGRNLEIGGHLYAKDFPEIVEEIGKNGRRMDGVRSRASGLRRSASVFENAPREVDRLRVSLAAAVQRIRSLTAGVPRELAANTSLSAYGSASDEPGLGMSFEVTNVKLADPRARVWMLTSVLFTGAAILRREKAAFSDTWIELAG